MVSPRLEQVPKTSSPLNYYLLRCNHPLLRHSGHAIFATAAHNPLANPAKFTLFLRAAADFPKNTVQRLKILLSQLLAQFLFDRQFHLGAVSLRRQPGVRKSDDFSAPVGRVRLTLHNTGLFKVKNQLLHGLFADPHPRRNLCLARAFLSDVGNHTGPRLCVPAMTMRDHSGGKACLPGRSSVPQQPADMVRPEFVNLLDQ